MLHEISVALNYGASHVPWDAIWASGIISPFLVIVKKWRITKNVESLFQKDWFVYLTLLFISFATAAAHYLLTAPISDPSIIAIQTAVLAFLTQPIYFFAVKPLWKAFSTQLEKAAAYDREVRSAAEPIPAPRPVTQVQDFAN